MALIKCPHCGHGVLSVASQCPKCAAPLTKSLDLGGSGELAECRRCGRAVLSSTGECANCGARHPARSYARGIALTAITFVALSGWITVALLKERARERPESRVPVAVRAGAARADSKAVSAPGASTRAADVRPAPTRLIFVTPADSKRVATLADARPAPEAAPRQEFPRSATSPAPADGTDPLSAAAQPQLAAAWANVREEPSPDAAVVKVLRPGQQVDVVRRRGGWWAVYAQGRRVGYVSRSLLVEQAPNTAVVPVTN